MRHRFFLIVVMATLGLTWAVLSCDSDKKSEPKDTDDTGTDTDVDSDSDTGPAYDGPVKISGAMQKGPLLKGSNLTVAMMDATGTPSGLNYSTTTESDLGSFNVVAKTTGPCELVGEGYYFNEISNKLSGAPITLRAVYEIVGPDPQKAYLNVFTHMSSGLAKKLLSETPSTDSDTDTDTDADVGITYSVTEAVTEAEDTLFSQLGIHHPDGALQAHGTAMNLIDPASPDNEYLMSVSCILGKAAQLRAADADEVDAKLQELLNDIRSQIETTGVISDEYKDAIKAGEAALDPLADCVDNLKAYLEKKTGSTPDLPDPNTSADLDDDGIPNASDPDIDGDGVLNADDEEPYNPKVGAGMYIDKANGLAWQLTPPATAYGNLSEPVAYCEDLSLGGHDDWRLPTISELRTLVKGCAATEPGGECGVDDSCIDSGCNISQSCDGCVKVTDSCYWIDELSKKCDLFWSSTTISLDGLDYAWTVDFRTGTVIVNPVTNCVAIFVRCVRSL